MIEARDVLAFLRDAGRASRKQAVAIAQKEKVCRLCLKPPVTPLILDYGREYACQTCLDKEFYLRKSEKGARKERMMTDEEKQTKEERDWWRRVGEIIGSRLCGWTYYQSAIFIEPTVEVDGKVAVVLLAQQEEIERLKKRIDDKIEQSEFIGA